MPVREGFYHDRIEKCVLKKHARIDAYGDSCVLHERFHGTDFDDKLPAQGFEGILMNSVM